MKIAPSLKNHAGSVPWKWLFGLAVAVAAISAAVPFVIPKPSATAPPRAIVRAKVPPLPSPQAPAETEEVGQGASGGEAVARLDESTAPPVPARDGEAAPAIETQAASESASTVHENASGTPEDLSAPAPPDSPDAALQAQPSAVAEMIDADAKDAPRQSENITSAEASPPAIAADPQTVSVSAPEAPYTLQLGVFRTKAYADELTDRVNRRGYAVYIMEFNDARKGVLYSVRSGHFERREEAARAASAFREKEKMAAVVATAGSL